MVYFKPRNTNLGIFWRNGKCWYILRPLGIIYHHLVWHMDVWYSLCSFSILFPFWYVWTKKNLATLILRSMLVYIGRGIITMREWQLTKNDCVIEPDPVVTFCSVFLIWGFVIWCILLREQVPFNLWRTWIVEHLTWLYMGTLVTDVRAWGPMLWFCKYYFQFLPLFVLISTQIFHLKKCF
jgi:hypothetical protein